MKRKILSYLLGTLLIFSFGYVHAQQDEKVGGCGEVPEGMVRCDGALVSAEIGCEGGVVKGCKGGCCGIKLNTKFPIIGNCIEVGKDSEKNPTNAFPVMIGALTKIIMSVIFVVCFIFIIYAGILWASNNPKEGKEILKKVAITILLLGFSGVILRLINPNFFG